MNAVEALRWTHSSVLLLFTEIALRVGYLRFSLFGRPLKETFELGNPYTKVKAPMLKMIRSAKNSTCFFCVLHLVHGCVDIFLEF